MFRAAVRGFTTGGNKRSSGNSGRGRSRPQCLHTMAASVAVDFVFRVVSAIFCLRVGHIEIATAGLSDDRRVLNGFSSNGQIF